LDSPPQWGFDADTSPRKFTFLFQAATERRRPRIRQAHGLHNNYFRESVLIRSAAEAKIREADRLECEAWNAIMWAGGPAMPSPGDPQAEPTIAKALNDGFDLLEASCNRCCRVSVVPLRALKQSPDTPVWKTGGCSLL
jgi:hypothetical protein